MEKRDEPEVFRRGKKFHKEVQKEWEDSKVDGDSHDEHYVKLAYDLKGRFDIFVDNLGDALNVVLEIKSTNWDKIKRSNARKNVRSHIRQIWNYINLQQERKNTELCVGVIYPQLPSDPELTEMIETMFNEEGIQVVWNSESIDDCKNRHNSAADKE